MKVYVDRNDEGFIEDSFFANNTRLISEFHHEESELEYDECELLDLVDYTKQVRKEENQRLEHQIDYVMKINIWLMKKYGKQFREDMGINENDNSVENLIKISKVYDNIYEEMKKEMPKKWCEYGFLGLNIKK